jgi:hypothetical protein
MNGITSIIPTSDTWPRVIFPAALVTPASFK